MRFPETAGASTGDIVSNKDKAPVKVSVNPQVELGGSLEAHLIPRLTLGVNLFNALIKAAIFLDLDASASTDMSIKLSSTASSENKATGPETSVSGSVGIDAGIAGRAGAEGTVPGFFTAQTHFDIFNKKFELFKVS